MEAPDDPGDYSQSFIEASTLFLNLDSAIDPSIVTMLWIGIAVLILFSALISGSEVAFFSLSKEERASLLLSKKGKALRISQLLEKPRYLLATILISNNLVNVGIIISSYFAIGHTFNFVDKPALEIAVNVVLITAILVIFGEVLPKVYANQKRLNFARFMAGPLSLLEKMCRPFSHLMVVSTKGLEKRLQKYKGAVSMEEIDKAIDLTLEGDARNEEARMLKGIIKFGNISAKQIMQNRVEVKAIEMQSGFSEVIELVRASGFSRIPVYEENLDQIKGILYAKDLLKHLGANGSFQWQDLIREPFFVPENIKIDDLLNEIREKRIHLAIVVDEYGGTTGIVTLEDVMEEVIGEIRDEYDDHNELKFKKLENGATQFEGKALINDICRFLELDINTFDDVKGDADSIGGLITEIAGKIPDQGESVKFENYNLKVEAVDEKRILKASLHILDDED